MQPFVSIILPTYNGARYIASAIASVQAQSYTNWELIIIDDGSTDDTEAIVQSFSHADSRIQYVKNEQNLGIQKTLNRGLALAKGEYIARIDDDDRWIDTDKLTAQVSFLESHPDYVLVGTGVIVVDESGKELMRYYLPASDYTIRGSLLSKNCFIHSSVVFKKEAVQMVGGYDESEKTRHIEDYDLWCRLGLKGKLSNLQTYSVQFTMRAGGLSNSNKKAQFQKNIDLIKRYKDKYPHFLSAYIRGYIRFFIYGFLIRTPVRAILTKVLRFYKKYW